MRGTALAKNSTKKNTYVLQLSGSQQLNVTGMTDAQLAGQEG